MKVEDFVWRDGERYIAFRDRGIADASTILRERGWERYELLSTPRALGEAAIELAEGAEAVHEVPPGSVPGIAAEIIEEVRVPTLVALGGGRVIDTAKAIAAVRGGRVGAIPSTLSGAPMTAIHRLPEGHQAPHLVRPALVLADPELMTSQAERELRATAMNALAHGADSLSTPFANPLSRLAALRGAKLIAAALDQGRDARDRPALALGALLSGYAIDSALFALHHVVCQSLVRIMRIPHAETNATMLPRTMEMMRDRTPRQIGELARSLGTKRDRVGERIEELGGGRRRLRDLGADRGKLDGALAAILGRPELQFIPDAPSEDEVRALLESAW